MKICPTCKETKAFSKYHYNLYYKDEVNYTCKDCENQIYWIGRPSIEIHQPDYAKHIKELKLDSINSHYPEALTIADWNNMTQKQKESYE